MTRLTPLLLCLLAHLAWAGDPDLSPRSWPEGELSRYENLFGAEKPLAESKTGMVVSTTAAAAARAGLEALNQGGSAVDAVLTHALAEITLVASCCVSHAGFMDVMVFEAATGEVHHLNGGWNTVLGEDDPLTIPEDGVPSGRASLVPGFMAGVEAAHERFGKLPFAALFGPAIHFAEEGFEVQPMLGGMIGMRRDVLSRRPETKAVFTKDDGSWYAAGDHFAQPELAHTLRQVAEQGAHYMYAGPWARKLVEAVRSEGGKMAMEDLERYQPTWNAALASTFRGYDVHATAQPNLGGVNMIEALNLVERAELGQLGHYTESPEALFRLTRIARVMDIMGTSLTHHVTPAALIERHAPGIATAPEERTSKAAAENLWQAMQTDGWDALNVAAYESRPQTSSGNHSDAVVAVDAEGNAAALLHTINTALWGTTGIFVDGVAIADSAKYQQTKIARAGPGNRLPIETNPVLITRDGKPVLVSSSIGMGVHEQTYQAIVNILEYGLDPKAAAESPQVLRPMSGGLDRALGAAIENAAAQTVEEGAFDAGLLERVRVMGQPMLEVSSAEASGWRGYWVGIHIDPETGIRRGAVSPYFDGWAFGQDD